MATIASFMTWALKGANLKSYLGISGSGEDSRLTLWLTAWAEAADLYVDGTDFDTLPPTVELAVFSAIELTRSGFGAGNLRSVRTRDLSQSFFYAVSADASFAAMRELLRPWKSHRELDGPSSGSM